MLKFLRRKKRSKIVIFILGAIILVFITWGMWTSGGDGKANIVARVDGKAIKGSDYQEAYQKQLDYYRNLLKEQLTSEMLERLNLRQRTLDLLINRILILNDAEKKGITISAGELQKAIQEIPSFQKDGVFDKERYLAVLKSNRIFPGEFEDNLRENIIMQRAEKIALDEISVSEKEVHDIFKIENRKVNLYYLVVDAADFEKIADVSDDEAEAYLEANKGAFRVPTRIKTVYASIFFKDLIPKVSVSNTDIKNYYEENTLTFKVQKELRASHILIKPSASAEDTAQTRDDARKKAEEVLSKLKEGEDFTSLAKKYSQDPGSAGKGGDLGYFKKGDMLRPFEEAAFSLKKGEVSGIIETDFGYHLIKVTDIKEESTLPLKEVKDNIEDILIMEATKKMGRDIMESIFRLLKEDRPLEELKKAESQQGVMFVETEYFSENERTDDIARYDELRKTAFSMQTDDTSDLLETPHGIYVVRVVDRKEEHLPTYGEVADKVKKTVTKNKAIQMAKEKAEQLLNSLKDGGNIIILAKKEGLKVEESGYITKTQGFIPKAGVYIGENKEIFSLTQESPYFSEPLKHGDKFYLLKLKGSLEADQKEFEIRKGDIKERLYQQRQQETLTRWIEDMRAKSKIEVNPEVL
jgi:peptidyl-prolyl cis-trans isomerase D